MPRGMSIIKQQKKGEKAAGLVGSANNFGPLYGRFVVSPIQKNWGLDHVRVNFGNLGLLGDHRCRIIDDNGGIF